jgi:hypothetical protein
MSPSSQSWCWSCLRGRRCNESLLYIFTYLNPKLKFTFEMEKIITFSMFIYILLPKFYAPYTRLTSYLSSNYVSTYFQISIKKLLGYSYFKHVSGLQSNSVIVICVSQLPVLLKIQLPTKCAILQNVLHI